MDKITIGNYEEGFEPEQPESIDDILALRSIKKSLSDSGISNFKEITDINKISFGHFIVIEKILGLELGDNEKVKMISPIILRPLNEEQLDNEDKIKEDAHTEDVMGEPVGNVYGAFDRYMKIRKEYLFKTYNGVIYGTLDEDEEDEEEEEGTNTNSGQSAREFHTKKFFWNSLIDKVAKGDIFKYNEVVDLMMFVVMPYLAEKRSLEIVEYLEHKASMI